MIFTEGRLKGAFVIAPEPMRDERGFFARTFCQKEFQAHGLSSAFVQCSVSYSRHKGTLRGMHYQVPPRAEVKLVRCTRGAIYDVIIDLRPRSRTYCQWMPLTISAENRLMLYVPEVFAHGFLTLEDGTEVFYQMSEYYSPEFERGVRWNDPAFGIEWPCDSPILSNKDRTHPDFTM
jgi:dTDP-4-dehydrorhamnose 3,5-epimerase